MNAAFLLEQQADQHFRHHAGAPAGEYGPNLPFRARDKTLAQMDAFAVEQGYRLDFSETRFHHEIYLSDPRRAAPGTLKTVLRHPIREK